MLLFSIGNAFALVGAEPLPEGMMGISSYSGIQRKK
jgi:hypothetical protein